MEGAVETSEATTNYKRYYKENLKRAAVVKGRKKNSDFRTRKGDIFFKHFVSKKKLVNLSPEIQFLTDYQILF